MRVCKSCGISKPASDYYARKGYKDGIMPHCKGCFKADRVVKRKSWSDRSRKSAVLKHNYGITILEYEALVEDQQGLCVLCQEPMASPHVDHCHITGTVRGLLCKQCNTGLGHFRDNPEVLARAVTYLRRA